MAEAAAVWRLYIVRAGDRSLYTGIATDVERRFAEHLAGAPRGARYLRGRAPLSLEWAVDVGDRSVALQLERRVKRLPRAAKESLIAQVPDSDALLAFLGDRAAR